MWKEYKKVLRLIDGKKMTASLCVNDIEKLFMKKVVMGRSPRNSRNQGWNVNETRFFFLPFHWKISRNKWKVSPFFPLELFRVFL